MQSFYNHMNDLIESIEDCARKCRILPCLTLLYSGIDVMASLDSEPGKHNRTSFVSWVDTYLLKNRSIGCTPLDLYAARCGVVHTFTADSSLYREGKAKKIAYAWGLGSVDDLRRTMDALGAQHDWRCVHTRDLIDAFRNGVANHLKYIENNPAAKERFSRASGLWFSNVDGADVNDFLNELDYKAGLL